MERITPALERYTLNSRVIDDLKKRSSIGIILYMILSFIVVFEEGFYQRNLSFSFLFLVMINGVCVIRFIHLLLFKSLEQYSERLNTAIFFATVLMTATIWGGCFAYFINNDKEYTAKLLVSICSAGLAAGGVVAFIPERRLSIVFNLLMLLPSAAMSFTRRTDTSLAVMIVMYSIYLVLLTLRGSREYWDALENEAKLKEKTVKLKRLSHTDPLTGLFNRRYFNEIYDFEWKRASRDKTTLTFIMCDIDYFKKVNDTLGHIAGDEYLISIAKILRNKFKRDTDIVARYGGEEFVMLLSGLDDDDAFQMTETLRRQIADYKVSFDGSMIMSTMSFGVASCSPASQGSPEHLIARADRALYRAKEKGRNRVEIDAPCFDRD